MHAVSFYIHQNGETKGPYSLGQLKAMWASGAVSLETLFCREGNSDWLPLRTIQHELELLVQPPPLPPPVRPQPTIQAPPRQKKAVGFGDGCLLVLLGLLALIVVSSFFSDFSNSTSTPTGAASGNSSASVVHLNLGKWRWHKSSDRHVTAEGEVTNISGESLKNVEAVVTFRTKNGDFITSSSALIDYNPILPNQTSPWKVIATWNPETQTASVEFKTLRGRTLNAEEKKR